MYSGAKGMGEKKKKKRTLCCIISETRSPEVENTISALTVPLGKSTTSHNSVRAFILHK